MAPAHVGLILLSCLFHSFWNVLTQTSRNSELFSGLKGIWILLLAFCFWSTVGFSFVHPAVLYWAVLSGVLHGLYILCLSRAYSRQDISYVYPIARSAPVFVPVPAFFFLGEIIEPTTLAAIGLILLAIYILHFEGHLLQGFTNLWQAILHRDLRWAFYTLAMVIAYSLVDKQGMDVFIERYPDQAFRNGIAFFFLEAVVGFVLYNVYLFWTHPVQQIMTVWKMDWAPGLWAGLATMGSYGLVCVVLQFEPVSGVVALRQVSVLMVVYWGCWKLGEPFGRQRLLAGGLTVLGVGCLVL